MKTKDLTLIAVMAAVLCVFGPLTIPLGPIPLTLANMMVYLAGAVLGSKRGTMAVGLYLLIGALGVPVFSGFSGGFQKFVGPTGGYLLGDLPCAFIIGLAVREGQTSPKPLWKLPVFIVLGAIALYTLGTAWFMVSTHATLQAALAACVVPFLLADVIKIAVASVLTWPIRKAVYRNQ